MPPVEARQGSDGGSLADALREALLRRQCDRSGRYSLAAEPRPCWHCGQPTRFLEVNFEAPLCPGACTEAKEAEYWQALSEGYHRDKAERDAARELPASALPERELRTELGPGT